MDSILEDWKSSKEMLEVRPKRRRRLCFLLTIIGSIFLFIFGSLSLIHHKYILGSVLVGSMLIGCLNIILLKIKNDLELATKIITAVLLVLNFTLLFTGGIEKTGLFWVYPIVAINMFVNRFWPAVYLNGAFLIITSLFLFTPLSVFLLVEYSQVESIRFVITLLALWTICLVALLSEERAYEMIIKLHNDDVHKLAFYDHLTGLPNRWTFQTKLERLLKRKKNDKVIALLYIDLDNFKLINDYYGHETGDQFLLEFSERLKKVVRPDDLVNYEIKDETARLAGDEFVVILSDLETPLDAARVCNRILELFENGFEMNGNLYSVCASIGISICPNDTDIASELLLYADTAMYKAKNKGKNRFEFFTNEMAETLLENKKIEKALSSALETNSLSLVYMPIINSRENKIIAYEALLRCEDLDITQIETDVFIKIAEASGLIKKLDNWVLENGLYQFVKLKEETGFTGKICINISGVELIDEKFPITIKLIADKLGLSCTSIELEITETALITDNLRAVSTLKELSAMGFSIALDDFGTGYTAFNQLINYPTNTIKIDRSFIHDLVNSESRKKMVKIIRNLAEIYDLRVVAEGVENEEQLDYLKSIGCDLVQGYFLSKPLKDKELKDLILKQYSK